MINTFSFQSFLKGLSLQFTTTPITVYYSLKLRDRVSCHLSGSLGPFSYNMAFLVSGSKEKGAWSPQSPKDQWRCITLSWGLGHLLEIQAAEFGDNLRDMSLGELQELLMYREAWRASIHGVSKCRTLLSDWTELTWTRRFSVKKTFPDHLQIFIIQKWKLRSQEARWLFIQWTCRKP